MNPGRGNKGREEGNKKKDHELDKAANGAVVGMVAMCMMVKKGKRECCQKDHGKGDSRVASKVRKTHKIQYNKGVKNLSFIFMLPRGPRCGNNAPIQ